MRRTGIGIVGEVPWGTHFCQFYRSQADLIDILVPYFKAGLESNEFCLWITFDPLHTQEAREALAKEVPNLEDYFRKEQIEILDHDEWYAPAGKFDPDRVIQDSAGKLEAALKRGFDGLRCAGNKYWLEKSDWQRFAAYEAELDSVLARSPVLAICPYNLAACDAAEIMDIVGNHAFALVKRAGKWQVIESAERKRVEEALLQQREWLRVTLNSIGDAVLATDLAGRITFVNPVAAALTGWTEQELLGRPVKEGFRIIDETTREEGDDIVARVLREGRIVTLANNSALLTREGGEVPIEDSAAPILDGAGNIAGVVLVFRDVTEKRRARQALQESERRVRLKLDSILSPEGDIGRLELADIIDSASLQSLMDEFYKLTGIPMAMIDLKGSVLVGVGWQDICTKFHRVHPESCRNCVESDTQLSAGVPSGECKLYKCKNNLWDVATPLTIGGRHVGNLFSGQFFFDDDAVDYEFFRAQARQYGFNEEEYLAALEKVPRLSREYVSAGVAFLMKLGQMLSLLSYSNIKLARSLAERDTLTASLKNSQLLLSRAQEIAHLGSWELDLVNNRLSWSDEVYRIFGVQPQGSAATYEDFLDAVHPEDRAAVRAAYSNSLREGAPFYEITHRVVRKSTGEVRWVHEKCEHIREGDGRTVRSVGMVQDVTERKQAEDSLRQAQKLESIGLLAGGIAHDFNNLLTGIMGHASMVLDDVDSGSAERIKEVIRGAERAANLTRQLLAYSGKGRFVLHDVNISEALDEMSDLMQFSIPKSVDLALNLQKRLPLVRMDPCQLEQVLMNLVINAGEAIGEGTPGKITIATGITDVEKPFADAIGQEVAAGRYVSIEVTDTGSGIAQSAQAKIFDPFFTTKFTGRGLGLAAVAGIIRSQKGAIVVDTLVGRGTTFRVLLPVADDRLRPDQDQPDTEVRHITVLVVDDESFVRQFISSVVRRRKYRVLEASDGRDALAACDRETGEIDAAVLDVVMPVMGARELLPKLKARRPKMKILLTSGYSESEARRLCDEYPDAAFIQKPYTAHQLAKAVDELLGTAN
jgi:PAS domain S-box-containing protein